MDANLSLRFGLIALIKKRCRFSITAINRSLHGDVNSCCNSTTRYLFAGMAEDTRSEEISNIERRVSEGSAQRTRAGSHLGLRSRLDSAPKRLESELSHHLMTRLDLKFS